MGSTNQLQVIDVNKLRKQKKEDMKKLRFEMGYAVLQEVLEMNNKYGTDYIELCDWKNGPTIT